MFNHQAKSLKHVYYFVSENIYPKTPTKNISENIRTSVYNARKVKVFPTSTRTVLSIALTM
jgi:hypothetical protein